MRYYTPDEGEVLINGQPVSAFLWIPFVTPLASSRKSRSSSTAPWKTTSATTLTPMRRGLRLPSRRPERGISFRTSKKASTPWSGTEAASCPVDSVHASASLVRC